MSNNLIESFLKYEEQRKAQKNPNEFQTVKSLQERNIIRRSNKNKDEPAPADTPPVGAGEALRPEIARNSYDVNRAAAAPEQGPPVSAMARPGDTRFGNFNTDGTVSGNTSVTTARAGVRTEPRAITPSTGDSVRDAANAGLSMTVPYANTSVVNTNNKEVSTIPTGGAAKQEPEDRTTDSTGGARSISGSVDTGYSGGSDATRDRRGEGDIGPATPEQIKAGAGSGYSGGPDATRDRREADDTPPPATPARPNDGNNRVSAPSQATLNTRPGLRAGSASADTVKAFQRELGITADGIAGPQTRQAVMDFQRKHGLQVDGIIGDQTRMAFERMNRKYAESVQFSETELAHFKSILEAMPVAPTAEGHGPNPTPKNKAEGGKGRGSLSEKMDPVGEEDKDVDNDGKVDKSDEYLKKRRAAIAAANMKKKK